MSKVNRERVQRLVDQGLMTEHGQANANRAILEGIARAKRPETRRRRLAEAVERARERVRRSGPEGPSGHGG